ncbi:hypothetical protein GJR95_26235 [Spirosoma endbachense]|uniref:Uncharacterized protein n=2 Tax=Spirosoma endbachense TaxID=2666025 RepID=A0A6P1W1U6_9BACT|nr:hypothetical protein GJR95_26235 [Spirosoma endbachense]
MSINIEPMITAMFELADNEHRNTPLGLGIIVGDAIRHLATNVPAMEKDELMQYRQMISQLYELQDMFEAMFIGQ